MTTPAIVLLVLLGLWGAHLWHYPYVTCKYCEGKKRKYASDGEHFRDEECWHCLTNGYRYRWELRWLSIF